MRQRLKKKRPRPFLGIIILVLLLLVKCGSGSNMWRKRKEDGVGLDRRPKSGRLFSNPFGILGHSSCQTDVGPNYKSAGGVCYNEVECLIKGGMFSGYCGPAPVVGVCCVFAVSSCDRKVKEDVSYFTNPGFPGKDGTPRACSIKILPHSDTCYIRLDFEEFDLHALGDGACDLDTMSVLSSPVGAGGKICGYKKGFSTVIRVSKDNPLELGGVLQSPAYKWKIKITQIKCDQLKSLPAINSCGITGAQGFVRRDDDFDEVGPNGNRIIRRRIKKRIRPGESEVCLGNALSPACKFFKSAIDRKLQRDFGVRGRELMMKRKLQSEAYRPAFSAREVFCRSKFRERSYPSFKIIDGTEAPINAYPWMASIQYGGGHFCGGNLYTERYVITAAHCMDYGNIKDFLGNIKVVFGEHDFADETESELVTRGVERVIFHPRYTNRPASPGDFALIRLDKPVTITPGKIAPVCIPSNPDQNFDRMLGVVTGWGVTETGELSEYLRQVELNIIPNVTCAENLAALDVQISDDTICTFKGPTGTETICSGDSGGPLMVRTGGKFVLAGVVSFSVTDCASPFPAGYAKVTRFLEWIKAALVT